MRIVAWIVRLVIFVLILGFAARNTHPVLVRFYLGNEWEAPMAFVLLVAFALGVAAGLAASLGNLFRQRREMVQLRKQLRAQIPEEVR
jgi:lipopolysaccharide assembly protein A